MTRRNSALLIAATLAFLLVAGVLGGWILRRDSRSAWHSPADTVRPWAQPEWDETRRSSTGSFPSGPPQLRRIIGPEWSESLLEFGFPEVEDAFDWPTETIRLAADHPFDGGTRRAQVEWLAVARPDAGDPDGDAVSTGIPYSLFHPGTLVPLNEAELKQRAPRFRHRRQHLQPDDFCPRFGIGLTTAGFDHPRWSAIHLFDARTHVRLNAGSSYSVTADGRFAGSCKATLWHPCPILTVLDLLHGPIHQAEVPLTPDSMIELGPARLRVVDVRHAPGTNSWSSHGDGNTNRVEVETNDTNEPETFVLIEQWPLEQFRGISWEALDHDGKKIQVHSHLDSGNPVSLLGIQAPPGKIRSLTVTLRTRRTRFLIEVPEIPGLPEDNRNVANLFDVRIPRLPAFEQEYSYRRTLAELVQLRQQSSGHSSTRPGTLPRRFAPGATPAEMAEQWNLAVPDQSIQVDQASGIIHFGRMVKPPGPLQRFLQSIRRFLR